MHEYRSRILFRIIHDARRRTMTILPKDSLAEAPSLNSASSRHLGDVLLYAVSWIWSTTGTKKVIGFRKACNVKFEIGSHSFFSHSSQYLRYLPNSLASQITLRG